MGSVFVTRTGNPGPADVEGREPLARITFGGTYFFLYPAILCLRDQTGRLIDPQTSAFFVGPELDLLQAFIVASQALAGAQPDTWEQRVGTGGGSGEVINEVTTRHDVLRLLHDLTSAVQSARERHMGVFFRGE